MCGSRRLLSYVAVSVLALLVMVAVLGSLHVLRLPLGEVPSSTVSTVSTPSTHGGGNVPVNTSALVRAFLANASRFYLKHKEWSLVDGFCAALILRGSVVNSTHILIPEGKYNVTLGEGPLPGGLYRYGVLAYMPPDGDYWFPKELRLGDVVITHIPPVKNITLTGDFGPTNWFRVSGGGVTKVLWFASYPGVVYRDKVVCSSEVVGLGREHVIIVQAFIARNVPGVGLVERSLWLALLPANTTQGSG